jgi:hypothetical protein
MFHTETRVTTTDQTARTKCRWYWARFSPGIVLIRRVTLGLLKTDAERRAGKTLNSRFATTRAAIPEATARKGVDHGIVTFNALHANPFPLVILWLYVRHIVGALVSRCSRTSVSVIGPLPSRYLHLAGGLGPMLAAVIVASLAQRQPGLAPLAKRCAVGGRWLPIAILIPAGLFVLATAIIATFYGAPIEWASIGRSTECPELPRAIYWLANVIFEAANQQQSEINPTGQAGATIVAA